MKALTLPSVVRSVAGMLKTALSAVIADLEQGRVIEEAVVCDLMARIRQSVPNIARADVVDLQERVHVVIELMTAARDDVARELKQVRRGKKALTGYSHLRGYKEGQRLNRMA